MGASLPPGAGEHGKVEHRIAAIERFLGPFKLTRIQAQTEQGDPRHFNILAATGRPGDAAEKVTGSFWGLYVKSGHTYLQGGTVSGGSGTKTIDDIKVLDGKTVAGTLVDKILWVSITVNGVASDGVLLPGANVTAAECSVTSTVGTQVPSNTLPTASSPSGKKVYVEIGRWTKEGFFPSKQGHIQVSFCPGSFTITR